jgi:isocitrate lyase
MWTDNTLNNTFYQDLYSNKTTSGTSLSTWADSSTWVHIPSGFTTTTVTPHQALILTDFKLFREKARQLYQKRYNVDKAE